MPLFTAAVVGYVLGRAFTRPLIEELVVDEAANLVYVRKAGAAGLEAIQS
jgi:hypothetical protein